MADVRVKMDVARLTREDGPWWCAYLGITLPDGTPINAASAIRESDLKRLLAGSYSALPVSGVGSFGRPYQIADERGYQIWYVQSGDAFRSDSWKVYPPGSFNGPSGTTPAVYSLSAGSSNPATDPAYSNVLAWVRAQLPATPAATTPAAPRALPAGSGPPGRHAVVVGTPGQPVPPTTPAAGGSSSGRSTPSGDRGAVLVVDAATAKLAGMPLPPPPRPDSSGLVKIGDPSVTQDQAMGALSSITQSLAQRIAAGVVQPSQLDGNNAVHATAVQWAPYVPPDPNAVPATPGSTVYPNDGGVPGGYGAIPPLPQDTYMDPSTGYGYAPSTGLYYDPASHQSFFPPDAFQDASTGYIYAPSTCYFYDPSTGVAVAQQCYPQDGGSGYGGDPNAYLASMWQQYGNVRGVGTPAPRGVPTHARRRAQAPRHTSTRRGQRIGDVWGDIAKVAQQVLGNDVVQKVLTYATPVLTVVQPEVGLALAAGQAAAHAVLNGQAHPDVVKAHADAAAASDDPLEKLAASVFKVLTGQA